MYATLPTRLFFHLTVKTSSRVAIGTREMETNILHCVSQLKDAAREIAGKRDIELPHPKLRLKMWQRQKQADYQLLTEFNCADLLTKIWVQGNYDDNARF